VIVGDHNPRIASSASAKRLMNALRHLHLVEDESCQACENPEP
jgi:hypothetical protein